MPRSSSRYLSLDAMRGLAAITVAILHYHIEMAPVGYLAVDFFFGLSGFVLAKAYGKRLASGGSVWAFIEARVVRLWPVFIGALIVAFAWHLQRTIRSFPTMSGMELGVSAMFNAFMFPSPVTEALYPFDPPFWSIAAELVINVVFALVLVRLGLLSLLVVAIAAAVGLLMMIGPPDYAIGGFSWHTIDLGLVRTLYSFTVGCLLARVKGGVYRAPSVLAIPVLALLGALLFARPSDDMRRGFDLISILFGLPLLLFIGSLYEPPSCLARSAAFLGDISYPLYAVHMTVTFVVFSFSRLLGVPEIAMLPIYLLLAIAAAAALGRYWDKPIRRWLSAKLALRRSAEPQLL